MDRIFFMSLYCHVNGFFFQSFRIISGAKFPSLFNSKKYGTLLGWVDVVAREKWFFGEISLRTKILGRAFGECNVFRSRCFQAAGIANQSLHLSHFVRR